VTQVRELTFVGELGADPIRLPVFPLDFSPFSCLKTGMLLFFALAISFFEEGEVVFGFEYSGMSSGGLLG
jgi:hypothetical protein